MNRIIKILIPAVYLLAAILFLPMNLLAEEPFVVDNTNQINKNIGRHLEFFEDKKGSLKFEDLLADKFDDKLWQKSSSENLNFGLTNSTIWIRFSVENKSNKTITLYLESNVISLDYIDLYYIEKGNRVVHKKSGDMRPFKERDLDYRNPNFKLSIEPNSTKTYHLSFRNSGGLTIYLTLYDINSLVYQINLETILLWIPLGILLSFLIYNLFFYFSLWELNYLYFSLSCFSLSLLLLVWNGFGFQYLWSNNISLENTIFPFVMFLFGLTGHMFCRSYLQISDFFPKLYKVSSFLIYIAIMGMVLSMILPFSIATISGFTFGLTSSIYVIPSLILQRRKFRQAIFFNYSISILIVAIVLYNLRTFGILPHNLITYWALLLTSTFMIVPIGLGLTEKINNVTNELEMLNESLEEIVVKRTKKLKETTKALWAEMEIARKIQTVLLPKKMEVPGFQMAGYMLPTDAVGGDYYDIINTDINDWILIGDVSGHGVPAGLIMMMVQSSIRSHVMNNPEIKPSQLLDEINIAISYNIENMNEQKFMTISAFSYDKNDGIVFSGKHEDILVYRHEKDEVEVIKTEGICISHMPLGKQNINLNLKINKGDILLLFTDGLIEAWENTDDVDGLKSMYGQDKLVHLLKTFSKYSSEEIKEQVIKSFKGYTFHDDVTFLILKKI